MTQLREKGHLLTVSDRGVSLIDGQACGSRKGHLLLARFAMELLGDEWYKGHCAWEREPDLSPEEQFCLAHGVHHAWLSEDGEAFEWAYDMCLSVEKMYWWLCAARRTDDLDKVVEDLNMQHDRPGIRLMTSLVRLGKRAIKADPRQWAGQVLGRLQGEMDLTRHAFMSGARRLLGKKPQALKALVPRGVSGLERADGAVFGVFLWSPQDIWSVAYSPDGLRVASASDDRTVRIWDARTGLCVRVLEGHTYEVYSVAYSPDGLKVASGSLDKTVRIWDAITGRCVSVLEGHTDRVTSVAYSPHGLRVASGSWDKTVRIWDANLGQVLHVLVGHTSQVKSVAYSPDGLRLASGSYDGTVCIWDTQTDHMPSMCQILRGHANEIWSTAYSPDGLHLASGSWEGTVCIWDTQTGSMLRMWEGHTDRVRSVAYSPDGLHLASASDDKTVRIWDTQTGLCVHVLEGHTFEVVSVAYSPDGLRVASASGDKTVRVWDIGVSNKNGLDSDDEDDTQTDACYQISDDLSIQCQTELVSCTFDNDVIVRERTPTELVIGFKGAGSVRWQIV